MSGRNEALEAFDREHNIPANVSLTLIDIPFWELVTVILKFYFAFLVASLMIGAIAGIAFGVWVFITEPLLN
jgi:hypothetical protein